MSAIELNGVGKRYRRGLGERRLRTIGEWGPRAEQWALRDVSLAVEAGESFGLVGRNGSGKSTALRVMAGVTRPTRGKVSATRSVSGLLALGEGFHPLLSGRENVITQAIVAGLRRAEAMARLPAITAFAELEDHMDQPLRTYSEGMRLRLAFAVAINVDPDILLIDEILAVGDLRFRQKCFEHLERLQSAGATIVVASHDLGKVADFCQRALWLSEGKVRHIGRAPEVVERFRASMVGGLAQISAGSPGRERSGSGEVEIERVALVATDGETTSLAPGQSVTVEIHYTARVEIDDAIFGVSVHSTGEGAIWLNLSTAKDRLQVGKLAGSGVVCLHLENVPLAAGSYWVDVGVYEPSWDRPYAYLWRALSFEVGWPNAGPEADPPHQWSFR